MGLGDNRNSARGALTEALGVKNLLRCHKSVLGSRLVFFVGFTRLLFLFARHWFSASCGFCSRLLAVFSFRVPC
jgi:hypothetical protein